MKLWLKFMGYVVGSFTAMLVYKHLDSRYPPTYDQPHQAAVVEQSVGPEQPEAEAPEASEPDNVADSQDYLASLPQIPQEIQEPPQSEGLELIDGITVIHGDSRGHFRGNVIINGVSMPFVIDTGASTTTIPVKLAEQAHLPLGEQNLVETANGIAVGHKSKIKEMKLGNAVLKNTDADINYSLDEVLIGMTTLKHFQMSLDSNTLKLIPNKGYGDEEVSFSSSEAKKWKKNIVCDPEGQNCKTVYGPSD